MELYIHFVCDTAIHDNLRLHLHIYQCHYTHSIHYRSIIFHFFSFISEIPEVKNNRFLR